ncbi:MAG TPA: hypothetical protein VGL58_08290 [Caulobacteraceae bacterium]
MGLSALAAVVALTAASVHADQRDRHVKIINATSHTIVSFYASNVDADDWQEDILGSDTLDPGDATMINIDDGTGHCEYDFKAVFDDGQALVRSDVNVCKIQSYTYTE